MTYFSIFDQKSIILVFFWKKKDLKNHCYISNQDPQICLFPKFHEKTKKSKFGAKNALFDYFWPKISYLGIFGMEFKMKNYCNFWNQHPRICLIAKYSRFWTKNDLWKYFLTIIFKSYCHIWNQYLRICLILKFREKTKMPKFGTKSAILGTFDQKCIIWVFLGKN